MQHFLGQLSQRIQAGFRTSQAPAGWVAGALILFVVSGLLVARFSAPFFLVVMVVAGIALIVTDLWVAFAVVGLFLVFQHLLLGGLDESLVTYGLVRYADEALILALAAVAPWHSRGTRIVPPLAGRCFLALAVALVVGLVSAILNGSPIRAIHTDALSLSKGFLVLFAALHVSARPERILGFTRGLTLFACGLALFGFFDLAFPKLTHGAIPLAGPVSYREGFRCLVGVFPNEGMSGWFFVAAACLPLARYLVLRLPLDLALSGFLLVASLLSYRRKPVVGLVFALGVVLLIQRGFRSRSRVVVAILVFSLIFVPLVGGAFLVIFEDAYHGYLTPADPMRVARNAMYIASWRIAVDYFPLGAGLGLFGGHASAVHYSDFYAKYGLSRVWGLTPDAPRFVSDAFFAHILGALGFIGAAAYLLALMFPVHGLIGRMRSGQGDAGRVLAVAAALVFLEGLVESVVAPVYETSLSGFVVFGLAGIALSITAAEAKRPSGGVPEAGSEVA